LIAIGTTGKNIQDSANGTTGVQIRKTLNWRVSGYIYKIYIDWKSVVYAVQTSIKSVVLRLIGSRNYQKKEYFILQSQSAVFRILLQCTHLSWNLQQV